MFFCMNISLHMNAFDTDHGAFCSSTSHWYYTFELLDTPEHYRDNNGPQ